MLILTFNQDEEKSFLMLICSVFFCCGLHCPCTFDYHQQTFFVGTGDLHVLGGLISF
jgi:hypothetical protein